MNQFFNRLFFQDVEQEEYSAKNMKDNRLDVAQATNLCRSIVEKGDEIMSNNNQVFRNEDRNLNCDGHNDLPPVILRINKKDLDKDLILHGKDLSEFENYIKYSLKIYPLRDGGKEEHIYDATGNYTDEDGSNTITVKKKTIETYGVFEYGLYLYYDKTDTVSAETTPEPITSETVYDAIVYKFNQSTNIESEAELDMDKLIADGKVEAIYSESQEDITKPNEDIVISLSKALKEDDVNYVFTVYPKVNFDDGDSIRVTNN